MAGCLAGCQEADPTNQFDNANSELNRNIKGVQLSQEERQQQFGRNNNQKLIKNNKCSAAWEQQAWRSCKRGEGGGACLAEGSSVGAVATSCLCSGITSQSQSQCPSQSCSQFQHAGPSRTSLHWAKREYQLMPAENQQQHSKWALSVAITTTFTIILRPLKIKSVIYGTKAKRTETRSWHTNWDKHNAKEKTEEGVRWHLSQLQGGTTRNYIDASLMARAAWSAAVGSGWSDSKRIVANRWPNAQKSSW